MSFKPFIDLLLRCADASPSPQQLLLQQQQQQLLVLLLLLLLLPMLAVRTKIFCCSSSINYTPAAASGLIYNPGRHKNETVH